MLFTLLTTLPPVVHIISTELEIPLTAVTVQYSASGSPIVRFPRISFPTVSLSKLNVSLSKLNVSLSNVVICTRGIGTKNHKNYTCTYVGTYTRTYICTYVACV